ncbi:DUF4175 domain-containing protein [Actibacterium pelagium]|uniref:ATPase n=1 Tax=Actibacterium pelagium TaxID=2029103 RepID=A0A917AHA4_9RHOB|nr:DUF4175 domain-containing protein [Actibacterium pelagium]GGE51486.1 ATPase [Actibacterium pelagium]
MATQQSSDITRPKSLRRALGLTRAGLVAERLVKAFWPTWTVLFVVAGALLLGLHEVLRFEVLWAGLLLGGGALIWTLARGVKQFHWPSRSDAQLALDATLPGRPLAALDDQQAIGSDDTQSRAVWQAHQKRMAARLEGVRAVEPDLRVSRRDPFGLRYVAFTAFLVALLFGSFGRVATVGAHATNPAGAALAQGPAWEGWIEPPNYTGLPSLYLNDIDAEEMTVPRGAVVTLRFYGTPGDLLLEQDISGPLPAAAEGDPRMQHQLEVTQEGKLSIVGPGGRSWQVLMLPDELPEVEVTENMRGGRGGEIQQPFSARDDYGVVAGRVTIRLDLDGVDRRHGLQIDPEPRDEIIVDLPMPLSGNREEFEELLVENFSEHAWARLPVALSFEVDDSIGQTSAEELVLRNLGGRRFFDPVAAALIEMRRDLLWSRENAKRTSQLLRTVLYQPDDLSLQSGIYLRLRSIGRDLDAAAKDGLDGAKRDEIAKRLWDLAIEIEDGDLDSARERLERAQDRLSEAMRNGATDEEIAELMEELRQAMDEYLRMLAEQAEPQENLDTADNGQQQEMTQQDLQSMMDRIQELMQQGRTAEAMQLLEQLRQMLENMQVTQGQGGQGQGQQSLQGLSETLREQQGLSDEAFRDLQDRFNSEQGQQGQEGEGQQGGEGQRRSLADRQGDLQRQLDEQQRNLPGLGGELGQATRDALDRAGRAMERAEEALRDDDTAGALDDQADAMDALREGMRNLGEALAQQQNQGDQGQDQARNGEASPRDPLGREDGNSGQFAGREDTILPGDDVYDRARRLMEEIRRRSSEQERPEQELDYLRRLLERF